MNCLKFRRQNLTDPTHMGLDAQRHAAECPECRRFFNESKEFESTLLPVIDQPIPDELASRIKLRKAFSGDTPPEKKIWPRYAIAASLLLVAPIGGGIGYRMYEESAMAREFRAGALLYLTTQAD